MDIKGKFDEIVNHVQSDPNIAAEFREDPIKVVESVLGVDLPDEMVTQLIDNVKEKVDFEKIIGEGIESFKHLFNH